MFHTSEARVPKYVRVRPADDQTAKGIVAASDVEAVSTVAFVLALIVEIAEEICEFVFALIPAASDDEAFATSVLTAEIAEASEDEAEPTTLFVLLLTAVVIVASAVFKSLTVFASTAAAIGVVDALT